MRRSYQRPVGDLTGYKTHVTPSGEKNLPSRTDKPKSQNYRDRPRGVPSNDSYPEQGLPITPKHEKRRDRDWRQKKPNSPGFQGPPSSGQSPDGKSLHEDKARTKSQPGEEYGHPYMEQGYGIKKRRPHQTAGLDKPFPGADRQHEQRGRAKKYHKKWYRRHRGEVKPKARRRYDRMKGRSKYKLDRERREEFPERFERKPSGGYSTNAERSKEYRDNRVSSVAGRWVGRVAIKQRTDQRRHRQTAQERAEAKRRRVRNRHRSKQKARARYKRVKNQAGFKAQQQVRRKHPERFKTRRSGVLTSPEIAFVIGEDMALGYVHSVSPMTGLVSFHRAVGGGFEFRSLPVHEFMDIVVFLSDEDTEAMFDLVDAELGLSAFDDTLSGRVEDSLVDQFVYDEGDLCFPHGDRPLTEADPFLIDPQDDDHLYGQVNLREEYQHLASFFYEKPERPGKEPDSWYDRGQGWSKKKEQQEEEDGVSPGRWPHPDVGQNPGSAKVIPWNSDLINKQAFRWRDLDFKLRDLLLAFRKSPLWDLYRVGRKTNRDVVKWFQERGWDMSPSEWEELELGLFSARVAALISDIEARSPGVLGRATGLSVKLKRVNARFGMWVYEVQGSQDKPYIVKVKAPRKGALRKIDKLDVHVSCSCPFWRWQGPEHWAKTHGYLYGRPRGTASKPVIKDPDAQHGACKHVLAVLSHVREKESVPSWWSGTKYKKRGSLRYLADSQDKSETKNLRVRRVAARYIRRVAAQTQRRS